MPAPMAVTVTVPTPFVPTVKKSGTAATEGVVCDKKSRSGSLGGGSRGIVAVIVCATVALRSGFSKDAVVAEKTSTGAVEEVLPRDGGKFAVIVAVPNPTAVTSNGLPSDPAGTSTNAGTVRTPGSEDESRT